MFEIEHLLLFFHLFVNLFFVDLHDKGIIAVEWYDFLFYQPYCWVFVWVLFIKGVYLVENKTSQEAEQDGKAKR